MARARHGQTLDTVAAATRTARRRRGSPSCPPPSKSSTVVIVFWAPSSTDLPSAEAEDAKKQEGQGGHRALYERLLEAHRLPSRVRVLLCEPEGN
uniref:Uncharacterized protein n=1 Tax=Arundo donax TaxID=35708 RepID=A0A0A9DVF5_ARUDO